LPNVWLGATATNQASWDKAIEELLKYPEWTRFISVEPYLEKITPKGVYPFEWMVIGGLSERRSSIHLKNGFLILYHPLFLRIRLYS